MERGADVVYGPILKTTEALPPVLKEVQNTVEKSFIQRVIKHYGSSNASERRI